jgi:hypothetical protein
MGENYSITNTIQYSMGKLMGENCLITNLYYVYILHEYVLSLFICIILSENNRENRVKIANRKIVNERRGIVIDFDLSSSF